MSESKHTPEPWPTDMRGIVFANGALACGYVARNSEPYHNSNRAVACVNACAGINPEAVPDLLEALKSAVAAPVCGNWYEQAAAAIAKAEGRVE